MALLRKFVHGIRGLFGKQKVNDELQAEFNSFIETAAAEKIRAGMPRTEAMRMARAEAGSATAVRDQVSEAGWESIVEGIWQDARFGWRFLLKSPGFTSVAILTLALGVGANTAIFSIVNAVLLRSLPFRDPDRLVRIYFNNPGVGMRDVVFSVPELDDVRTRSGVFEDVSTIGGGSVNLTGAEHPERLEFTVTHPNYFSMLGATPQIGRLFGPEDFALGFAPVAVISDGLWRRSYGADPSVLGRVLRLDNDPYTIVGVLPPAFRYLGPSLSENAEVFLTAGFSADPAPKPGRSVRIMPAAIGRLKPGITLRQAQDRLSAMAAELRREFPTDYPPQSQWTIEIQSLQESLVGPVRPMLLVLLGAVMLIVFIVSLNIANLLLARASGRQQEMAVRMALGASRRRVIRQMLTESLLLSGLGGLAGLVTAFGTLGLILRLMPTGIPRLSEVRIDWPVLGFALLVSLFTGLLFGLAPAIEAAKSALSAAIREGVRGAGYSVRTGRMRDLLIVAELAFAVLLMVGAGLLLRTLRTLLQEQPGFNPAHVVTASIWLPIPNDPKADPYLGPAPRNVFNRELLRRVRAFPGVEMAAITSELPSAVHDDATARGRVVIEDRPLESSQDLRAEQIRVSPDYFRLMQAALSRGRFFTEDDEDGKPPVVILDEWTARRYWPGREALGRRLRFGTDPKQPWMTVVGVVNNIKHDGLDVDGAPHIYISLYQRPGRSLSLALRTTLPASALEPQIREAVQSIDPGLPVFGVSTMNQVLDASLAPRRFSADLVSGFAGVALLLASIGIYGLLSYMVGQRSREIGLRMALGATRADVLKLFLQKGALLAAVGIIVGVILSASTASIMATLLYGVRPHDPTVFLVAPGILMAVAVLASYLPARRATRVDPMSALRET
ncbi:MAG TPA: ABC transporter permease [Candidatus Angelobacter sp.]|nr:ABC transporter permease [Candidatus Angelobacter sp.]